MTFLNFYTESKLVSASLDLTIRVWKFSEGICLQKIDQSNASEISYVSIQNNNS